MNPLQTQRQKQLMVTLLIFVVSFVPVHGWIEATTKSTHFSSRGSSTSHPLTILQVSNSAEPPNPCWQDMYDEDCAMETIFAAQYVASDWIKKLPCAKGLEDCDFPEDVNVPEIRPESHPEEINVMEFLNIKRAKSVKENVKE